MTVDELAAKTIEAVGGEAAWRKITSRVVTADVDLANQGVQAKAVSYAKAPNKIVNEITLTALGKTLGTGYDFYDGTTGEESYSFAPEEKYSGKKLDDARLAADFYAPLDWKTNFKKIEIAGTAKVGDEEAYVVSFEPKRRHAVQGILLDQDIPAAQTRGRHSVEHQRTETAVYDRLFGLPRRRRRSSCRSSPSTRPSRTATSYPSSPRSNRTCPSTTNFSHRANCSRFRAAPKQKNGRERFSLVEDRSLPHPLTAKMNAILE